MKKIVFIMKLMVFFTIFYLICLLAAFFFRDDAQSYTRVLFKEFYNQKNIDILFCGASHVSHGLYPKFMDEKLEMDTFCSGTPNQRIDGTYAIIQEAVARYNIKEIWLEMDFAVARTSGNFNNEGPSKSTFLVSNNLRNPKNRFFFILNSTSPKYWLNSLCPVGIDSLIDLDPLNALKRVGLKFKRLGKGDDYDIGESHSYGGKGCVLDEDVIENGTYIAGMETPIDLSSIKGDFEKYIKLIIGFCQENNIKLVFYCQPQSDFYLASKTNYDEYHNYIKKLISPYDLIDFNYIKPEIISFEDQYFYDDNHFNKDGVVKFTDFFCNFYKAEDKTSFFCSSFNEKLSLQDPKVLGLMLEDVGRSYVKILPVMNCKDYSRISLKALFNGEEKSFICGKDGYINIDYPPHSSGYIEMETFYDGVLNHKTSFFYSSL